MLSDRLEPQVVFIFEEMRGLQINEGDKETILGKHWVDITLQ